MGPALKCGSNSVNNAFKGFRPSSDEAQRHCTIRASFMGWGKEGTGGDDAEAQARPYHRSMQSTWDQLANKDFEPGEINLQTLNQLLESDCTVHTTDRYGQTVLHEIAKSWHPDVARYLIERGADVNKADRFGVTPLHVAAAVDYPEMVAFLINSGAKTNAATTHRKQTPIHYAAKHDAVESLKVLLENNSDVNARDYKHRTPLQLAAELDRSESARLLLNVKADASVHDHTGLSCLTLLVVNMPPVASLALDQFHVKDRASRKQYFHINHLEHDLAEFKGSHAKSPLEVIVQTHQLDIIMHPVIQKLIEIKWQRFGRKNIAIMLCVNFIFIVSWTVLGIASSLDRTEEDPYLFPEDAWRIVVIAIALGLTIYQLVEEFKEIHLSRKKFKSWKDWRQQELTKDLRFCHPMWPEEKQYIQKGIKDLDESHPAYLKDFWNLFDWLVYLMLLVVITTHIAEVVEQDNPDLHLSHVRFFSVTIIFLWLRIMKHVRAIRALGPFIVMLGKIISDILKFLFLYGEFYIPYACSFWIIYGGKVPKMNTVPQLLFNVFRITLIDDYGFDDMYDKDPVMAYILCGTFLGVSSILCINLLIALLSDAFQRVYDNATANAAMQQACTLLQIEEHLSKKNKDRFQRHIKEACSPVTLFYDDDLTSDQHDDLNKITFQIKPLTFSDLPEDFFSEDNRIHNLSADHQDTGGLDTSPR
ncbi:transient receptor potential channel pyrexia-like [Ambystoma mexicanum]|uniref:transient receptor potential channel pyrexia-like n=1 Tax=Ambystoma mexicanum TaxID=8296 RepID=UPI0037E84B92